MHATQDASVEDLRRESERARAALTSTVVELREKVSDTASDLKARVSPENIKQELRHFVSETKQSMFQSIEDKVRENPLQAVAVGAAVAYPLWGILRTIPGPLMLVGAGLWLASKSGRQATAQVQDKAQDWMESVGDRTTAAMMSARSAAERQADRMSQAVDGANAAVSSRVSGMTDAARASLHDVQDTVAAAGHALADSASRAAASASEIAAQSAQALSQTAADARARVVSAGNQSRDALLDTVERNPLLVGGIGLALGAFVAALLPKTQAENRAFGQTSEDLKQKASDLASQGVSQGMEHAKDFAAGVVGDIAAAAAREGLDSEGLKKTVEGVTESVKSVAQRGTQAVLGEGKTPEGKTPEGKSQSAASSSSHKI